MNHYAPLLSALVSMLLITVLRYSKAAKEIQDVPNERSLHTEPTPRVGGVGLVAGVFSGWALMLTSMQWWIVLPMLILLGISLVDDMRGLPVRQRFMGHVLAAILLAFGSGVLMQHPWAGILVVLAVVWMTNLFNFMDGSDGLAGGMAFWGFTTYGVASLIAGRPELAMINFAVGAAALGFLYHNFYPAKVFMGDAGSIPLGFLSAGMGLWGWQLDAWPAWFPFLVFSPFIVDASVTLVRRTLRGVRITEAHREHYYQRLIQAGWGHRKVAVAEYVLMLAAAATSIWALVQGQGYPWSLLAVWLGIYAALMVAVDRRWNTLRRQRNG